MRTPRNPNCAWRRSGRHSPVDANRSCRCRQGSSFRPLCALSGRVHREYVTSDGTDNHPDREALSLWLRSELARTRFSLRSLAIQSGVTHSTISRLIHQTRVPTLDTFLRLQSVLGPMSRGGLAIRFEPEAHPQAVETALRADPEMSESDVRAVMQRYIALRERQHETRRIAVPGSTRS